MARRSYPSEASREHSYSSRSNDAFSDMQSIVSNLNRRMAGLASATRVDDLERKLAMVEAYFAQTITAADSDSAVAALSRRVDGLCSMADKTQHRFLQLLNDKSTKLGDDLADLAKKQRKIIDKTNQCIGDIKKLREELQQVRAPTNLPSDGLNRPEESPAANMKADCVDHDTTCPDLYWKDILRQGYRLPDDVDMSKVRIDNERGNLLCNRVAARKYYLSKNKMDFTKRRVTVRQEYVHEFLQRVKEDCPAVRVGKTGRPFRIRV